MRTYARDDLTTETAAVLSFEEYAEATEIGEKRRAQGRSKPDRAGFYVDADRRAARCELGAAKILGLPWNCPYTEHVRKIRGKPDVGPFQIRSVGNPDGMLVIRDYDRDDQVFILALEERREHGRGRVTCRVRLLGWFWGGDAKCALYWSNPPMGPNSKPAWFVPQRDLRPMRELPQMRRTNLGVHDEGRRGSAAANEGTGMRRANV